MLRGMAYESNECRGAHQRQLRPHGPPGHPHAARAGRRSSRSSRASPGPTASWSSTPTTTWWPASRAGCAPASGCSRCADVRHACDGTLAAGGRAFVLDGTDAGRARGFGDAAADRGRGTTSRPPSVAWHVTTSPTRSPRRRARGPWARRSSRSPTGCAASGRRSASGTGRLDLYRRGETTVVVDFAHNEAGVAALVAVGEGLVGRQGRAAPGSRRWP